MLELLLNCARQTMSAETVASTRKMLRQEQPWNLVLALAWRHGTASLLHANLQEFFPGALIPPEVRRRLYVLYEKTAYKNRLLLETLGRVLGLFANHRIPVMPLKGAFLSQQVYREIALRPFLDLDLLIQREDYPQAKRLLLSEGFELEPGLLSEQLCWDYHFNLPFVRKNDAVVELHWKLTDTFSNHWLNTEALWSRAVDTALCGRDARVLCIEDLITHLTCHLSMHGYLNDVIVADPDAAHWVLNPLSENRLIWFTDLYEVISAHRQRIDWGRLISRARETGADIPLFASLTLLNRLFGPVVEPDILSRLRSPRPRFVQRRLYAWLKSHGSPEGAGNGAKGVLAGSLLPKRNDVQFRLIRLVHVWDYIFPRSDTPKTAVAEGSRPRAAAAYLAHVVRAVGRCTALAAGILWHRLRKGVSGGRAPLAAGR